jgi:hypothetical protein
MFFPDSFEVCAPGDREMQVTRDFDAPRRLVFDAFSSVAGCLGHPDGPCRCTKSTFAPVVFICLAFRNDGSQMAMGGACSARAEFDKVIAKTAFYDVVKSR